MKWSDFIEMEKDTLKDKDINVFTRVFGAAIVAPVYYAVIKADKALETITGKGIIERGVESMKKEEEEKKNHYWKWAGKKLLRGTIKGVLGGSI